MNNDELDAQRSKKKLTNPLLLSVLGSLGFIALLVVIIYLTNRLETLEDRLSYRPPTVKEVSQNTFGINVADTQTVYVPIYSHIYSKGGEPFLLETTLSIRNSDPQRSISVTSARYFDTKGELIQDYVMGTVKLKPLETTEILVEKRDTRGGSGANFIVAWSANQPVYEPIIEAVMVGHSGDQSVSFKSIGRPLVQRTEQRNPGDG